MIYIPKMIFLFFLCCPYNDCQVILEIKTEIGELKGAK